ncbi:MAG: LUD domain-containing protein [Halobacteriaceae archaeon]
MTSRQQKADHLRQLLEEESDSVRENTTEFNQNRYAMLDDFDAFEELRMEAREIKEKAIAQLPELIDDVTTAVEENGGNVYLADDAIDAQEYITSLGDQEHIETAVKSKSMTTEEIDLNEALNENGIDVWETDLGEFVIQVAEESPSHIVGPSIHKSRDEIAELFNSTFDIEDPLETADELTTFARNFLGKQIKDADLGITGANFIVAESGSIVLITNEGNARKCAVTPSTHVAVAGVEKLLPSFTDLTPFLELIAKSATGQNVSQYISIFSPPVDTPTLDFSDPNISLGDIQGEREFHLVLIDNGRFDLRDDDQLRETLYCIRCGACSNSCANFQSVGGHGFGGNTYSGGIATGWEAGIYGLDQAGEFNDLCTGCTRCVNACPVKIDIPWINTVVRDRRRSDADTTPTDFLVDGLKPNTQMETSYLRDAIFANIETFAKIGITFPRITNTLSNQSVVRGFLERAIGIDRRRELPTFANQSFISWFANRTSSQQTSDRNVLIYPDVFTNYFYPERGKALVHILEALGIGITVPSLPESGRAPLSQGMIETATDNAQIIAEEFLPAIENGQDILVIEPSDYAMFKRDYEKLLQDEKATDIANACFEAFEYLYGLKRNGYSFEQFMGSGSLAYHSHCQQRTLNAAQYTITLLEELGYDVVTSDVECCGMAGSFGYKEEYYDVSLDVGEQLAEQFEQYSQRQIIASGISCQEQLATFFDHSIKHPLEIINT